MLRTERVCLARSRFECHRIEIKAQARAVTIVWTLVPSVELEYARVRMCIDNLPTVKAGRNNIQIHSSVNSLRSCTGKKVTTIAV